MQMQEHGFGSRHREREGPADPHAEPPCLFAPATGASQVHGAAGVSDVTPLAHMFAGARTLRLADGPDIVHLETIAKLELSGARRARL